MRADINLSGQTLTIRAGKREITLDLGAEDTSKVEALMNPKRGAPRKVASDDEMYRIFVVCLMLNAGAPEYGGATYKEACKLLGINPGTTKALKHRLKAVEKEAWLGLEKPRPDRKQRGEVFAKMKREEPKVFEAWKLITRLTTELPQSFFRDLFTTWVGSRNLTLKEREALVHAALKKYDDQTEAISKRYQAEADALLNAPD